MSTCVNFAYWNSWISRLVGFLNGVNGTDHSDLQELDSFVNEHNVSNQALSINSMNGHSEEMSYNTGVSQDYVSDIYPFIIPDSIMRIIHERLNEDEKIELTQAFKSDKYVKSNCEICCIENKDGVLLKCCQEKQFICFRCFMDILIYQNSKHRQITPELISYTGIYILENYKVNCPYCNQPTTLSNTECIHSELLKTLYTASQTYFNYRKSQ